MTDYDPLVLIHFHHQTELIYQPLSLQLISITTTTLTGILKVHLTGIFTDQVHNMYHAFGFCLSESNQVFLLIFLLHFLAQSLILNTKITKITKQSNKVVH